MLDLVVRSQCSKSLNGKYHYPERNYLQVGQSSQAVKSLGGDLMSTIFGHVRIFPSDFLGILAFMPQMLWQPSASPRSRSGIPSNSMRRGGDNSLSVPDKICQCQLRFCVFPLRQEIFHSSYCKTLIFCGHFILALLAVKEKKSQNKKPPIKIKAEEKNNKLAVIYSQYTTKYDIEQYNFSRSSELCVKEKVYLLL